MPSLIEVPEFVRDARAHIESGQVNDAADLLEAIEYELARCGGRSLDAVDQRLILWRLPLRRDVLVK